MTRTKQSNRWNEATARAALAEWAASKLTDEQFASEKRVSSQRLYYWRKRLRDTQGLSKPPQVAFVPVTLPAKHRLEKIEIVCKGVVVRVREDIDVSHIARLVDALSHGDGEC